MGGDRLSGVKLAKLDGLKESPDHLVHPGDLRKLRLGITCAVRFKLCKLGLNVIKFRVQSVDL